jgi:hypothetical protein
MILIAGKYFVQSAKNFPSVINNRVYKFPWGAAPCVLSGNGTPYSAIMADSAAEITISGFARFGFLVLFIICIYLIIS